MIRKILRFFKNLIITLLVFLLAAAAAVAALADKNVKVMNTAIQETLDIVSDGHKVTLLDVGDYSKIEVNKLMKFYVRQYEIEDIGNLSVMTVNVGLMQMASIVFTPIEKNLPLLSCDYMYILNNRKAYVELYDLVEEKDETYLSWMDRYAAARDEYASVEDLQVTPAWYKDLLTVTSYKKAGMKQDVLLRSMLRDIVTVYMQHADDLMMLTPGEKEIKLEITKTYTDRLIDEGGISTDFFKNFLGPDKTRDFFDKVFFGTARYK